ncbi:MAG TPA: hypothetical protein VHO72_00970, partial [Bacteroidales bacterium]|nr:hypothetical protein [Bacteroidales bacterium]
VFYFTLGNCDLCIDAQISNILALSKKIGNENILIIVNGASIRDVVVFKNKYNIKFTIAVSNDHIGLPIENENVPFCLIIDKSFLAKDIFVPIKEFQEYNERYYKIIYKKYWN